MQELNPDQRLLEIAAEEIRTTRRRMEVLQAKVDTMELMDRMLSAREPSHTMAFGEDVLARIDMRMFHLKFGDAVEPTPSPQMPVVRDAEGEAS